MPTMEWKTMSCVPGHMFHLRGAGRGGRVAGFLSISVFPSAKWVVRSLLGQDPRVPGSCELQKVT